MTIKISQRFSRDLLHFFYLPYKWLVFAPCLVFTTIFLGSIAIVLTMIIGPALPNKMAILWAKINGRITPMFISKSGESKIDPRQSYVIVSNHQSQFDIFVLYGWMDIDFKWVMKQELRKVPVLGLICEKLGHIYIDRADPKSAIDSINSAKGRIKNGTSVVFFPEGTRSKTGKMKNFKKGAFKFAKDLNLPILPVTITGTHDILPAKSIKLLPGKAGMVIHDPIDTGNYSEAEIEKLMDNARSVIQSAL